MTPRVNIKRLVLTTTAAIAIAGGTVVAFSPDQPTLAEPTLPIVEQVEDHEVRITDLEVRADDTDARVEQNTTKIVEVERTVNNTAPVPAPAPVQQEAPAGEPAPTPEPTPAPAPTPTPAPQPIPDARTIVSFTDTPDQYTPSSHVCKYKLYSAYETSITGSSTQPNSMPCIAVGEVLPR